MSQGTGISWTDATLNAATGCTEVSAGCDYCYARLLAERLRAMGQPKYAAGFEYREHPEVIPAPLSWRKPQRIFVNSMSDVFHEKATKPFVWALFDMMLAADWHIFQVLTKRPGKAASWLSQFCRDRRLDRLPWHIWVGTSVENQSAAYRLEALLSVPALLLFVSAEPLLGPLDLSIWLLYLGWVITGGESGPNARPFNPDWAVDIRDQCATFGVPFFHKQQGGRTPNAGGCLLDGQEWKQFPVRPGTPQPQVVLL